MNDEIVWLYVGNGLFIDGVPARPLTTDDMLRLDRDGQAAVEYSGLYQRAPQPVEQDDSEAGLSLRVTREEVVEVGDSPETAEEALPITESGAKSWKRERAKKE